MNETFTDDFIHSFTVDIIGEDDLSNDVESEEIKSPAINGRIVK